MTHVSELVLEVLDQAAQVAAKEGMVYVPPPPKLGPTDDQFRKAAQTALRRFQRAQRVREYLDLLRRDS